MSKPTVFIFETHDGFAVKTPWIRNKSHRDAMLSAWRQVPGSKWDKAVKLRRLPKESGGYMLSLLKVYFYKATALGPKGIFIIGAPVPQPTEETK